MICTCSTMRLKAPLRRRFRRAWSSRRPARVIAGRDRLRSLNQLDDGVVIRRVTVRITKEPPTMRSKPTMVILRRKVKAGATTAARGNSTHTANGVRERRRVPMRVTPSGQYKWRCQASTTRGAGTICVRSVHTSPDWFQEEGCIDRSTARQRPVDSPPRWNARG